MTGNISRDVNHDNNFDLIRLFAASQVATVHICEHLKVPSNIALEVLNLFPGVPIFFFVSGFLVVQSLERSKSLNDYIIKRVLRIYPALLVCFAFSIVMVMQIKPLPWFSKEMAIWIFSQVTIGQFYNPNFLRDFGVGVLNGSLWTIPVELQFYISLPFVNASKRFLRGKSTWLIFLVGAIIHSIFLFQYYGTNTKIAKLLQVSILPWISFFMLGVLASNQWKYIEQWFRNKFIFWLSVYCVITVAICQFDVNIITGNRINLISACVLFATVISAAFTVPRLSYHILKGNDISYGLYLYHALFINLYLVYTRLGYINLNVTLGAICVFIISIVVAWLSWLFVERPALAFKRN